MNTRIPYVYQSPEQGEGGAGAGGGGGAGGGAGAGAGAGGGAAQVTPADARAFVSNFVADPKSIEALDDAKILAEHTRFSAAVDKVRPKGGWPETWRLDAAGGDEKIAKRLERYATPKEVANALLSVQTRIGAGELRSMLPKDADAATVTAWRAENGIPETHDKYDLKLPDGLVVGAEDKPYIDKFLAKVHGTHVTNQQASAFVDAYYDIVATQAEERAQADKKVAQETHDALVASWGTEYRANMNMIHGLLDAAPSGVKDKILTGRGPDDAPLMADKAVIEWLNGLAREINPVTTVVANAGGNVATAIEDEIAAIEKDMRDRNGQYYKGPVETKNGRTDTKMALRYNELLGHRERLKAKAA